MAIERTDYQRQIIGCIAMGDYNEASKMATNGNQEDVLAAMHAAFRDGYNEALRNVNHTVAVFSMRLPQG